VPCSQIAVAVSYLVFGAGQIVLTFIKSYGNDIQINIGDESSIQNDFPVAKMLSLLQGCKIQKFKIDRLFYFVDIGTGKENFRYVGVSLLDMGNRVWIKLSRRHGPEYILLVMILHGRRLEKRSQEESSIEMRESSSSV
jgi:hypothetical protein